MNTAQLKALLVAGLITQGQYDTALATRTGLGVIAAKPTLDLHLSGARLELPDDAADGDASRTLHGLFSRYDELIPSHGLIIHAGAVEPRMPLSRVKVLRDHNHADPLGYVTALDTDTLEGDLYIAPDSAGNGDRALEDVANGIRDGLSIGFLFLEYEFDDDWILHAHRVELYEVSLCAIPAVADAGIYSVAAALATARKESTMNRAQLAAALRQGAITQEQHDAEIAKLDAADLAARPAPAPVPAPAAAVEPVAPELAAGPQVVERTATPAQVRERLSYRDVVRHVAAAFNTGNNQHALLALADIVPADDEGNAFVNREDWFGELWRATAENRPWVDAFGPTKELTRLKGKGWRWDEEPEPDEYEGNKKEVPTGPASTEEDTFTAFRVAGGWDIDRAYVDFGDEDFLTTFWNRAVANYKIKSNRMVRARVIASAHVPETATVAAGGVKAVLKQVIRDGRAIPGGKINRVFLGDALFEELEDIDTEKLPLWLKSAAIGLDIAEGTADVGTLRIVNDTELDDSQIVAFDSRAALVREKSPIQVKALDVAHGGIDLGFFSYLRFDDHDPRLLVKRSYAGAPAPVEP